MRRVLDPLAQMGALVDQAKTAPFWVDGSAGALRGFDGEIAVASAQVKSCIVFAALRTDGPSRIVEPGPSRDHTERMLAAMGADIEVDGATIHVRHPEQRNCILVMWTYRQISARRPTG